MPCEVLSASLSYCSNGATDRRKNSGMMIYQAQGSLPLTPDSSDFGEYETRRVEREGTVTKIAVRKGHRKSLRGCYDCKRRKIKCQETKPSCQNCRRLSLSCRYASEPATIVNRSMTVALQQPFSSLQVANVFNLTDMRLFHHFLVAAFPHLPVRGDNIWLEYVAPIAHQCDYLMHAMLSLSASHLSKLTSTSATAPNTTNLILTGEDHRLAALRGLNTALENPLTATEFGDAAIATCYALLMQSWYVEDGLSASLILTRSVHFTSAWVRDQKYGKSSLLSSDDRSSRVKTMKDRLRGAPLYDKSFVEGALVALDALGMQCIDKVHSALWSDLRCAYMNLTVGPVASYNSYVKIDHSITLLDPESMQGLLDTANETGQLLLAYLVALHLVMRPISCRERKDYTVAFYSIRMSGWIPGIWNAVGQEAQMKLEWPMWVSDLHRKGELENWSLEK